MEERFGPGEGSKRYLMIVDHGIITHLRVEPGMLQFSCTRAADAIATLAA